MLYPYQMRSTTLSSILTTIPLLIQTLVLALLLWPIQASAVPHLVVSDSRIIFEAGTPRHTLLTLANNGTSPATYSLSLRDYHMTEYGAFTPLESGNNPYTAQPMLLFAPQRFTINPGQFQKVRIMVRKPPTLQEGEYRSHLLLSAVETPTSASTTHAIQTQSFSITLHPRVSMTIPVIIRHGALTAQASISHATVKEKTLLVTLKRSGNKSLYGDLSISHISSTGNTTHLWSQEGLAVYTPNTARLVQLPLPSIPNHGTLHITYTPSTSGDIYNHPPMAEYMLPL